MGKKIEAGYMKVTLFLTMAIMMALPAFGFAASKLNTPGRGASISGTVTWPWTRFLNSLASELTGPLPLVLGLIGISIAAMALLFGNGGAGTQKALLLIGAVSVAMFTPTLVTYIYQSATQGATVDMVIQAMDVAATIASPPLP